MNKLFMSFLILILSFAIFTVSPRADDNPFETIDEAEQNIDRSTNNRSNSATRSETTNKNSKVSYHVNRVINEISESAVTRSGDEDFSYSDLSSQIIKVDDAGNVDLYIYCNEINDENIEQLLELGLIVERINEDLKIIHGWLPFQNVDEAAELEFVKRISPPSYGHIRSSSSTNGGGFGPVVSEGLGPLNVVEARDMFGVDGTGVKVGVISDGVDSLAVSQGMGELPAVQVGDAGDGDEGTAMLEIVADVAPGAMLGFHSGFDSSLQFIDGIQFFIDNNYDVIVDDIGYLSEPYFQDGSIAQKVQEAIDEGIVYLSSAGNSAQRHYQAQYVDSGDGFNDHDFGVAAGGSSDVGQTIEVLPGGLLIVWLQWSDPWDNPASDFDMDLFIGGELFTQSVEDQTSGAPPVEVVGVENLSLVDSLFVAVFVYPFAGPSQILEINYNGFGFIPQYNTSADSIYGHPAVVDALAIAAHDWETPNTVESFSSWGPSSIISPTSADSVLLTNTTVFSSPVTRGFDFAEIRNKPDITAPDGVTTTAPGFDPFFGTSASAPHGAGVAALVLEEMHQSQMLAANPAVKTRQVEEVRDALTDTAVDIGSPGYDLITGFGRIDAFAAVESVSNGGGGGDDDPGDANGDGSINILDITATVNAVLQISMASGNAECNEDGQVNILDITCVVNKVLQGG